MKKGGRVCPGLTLVSGSTQTHRHQLMMLQPRVRPLRRMLHLHVRTAEQVNVTSPGENASGSLSRRRSGGKGSYTRLLREARLSCC